MLAYMRFKAFYQNLNTMFKLREMIVNELYRYSLYAVLQHTNRGFYFLKTLIDSTGRYHYSM